jgi:parvulin-like peptidyl-prolyl isomerase
MKKLFLSAALLGAPILFAQTPDPVLSATTNGAQITAVDGYAARVNSTIITYGEVRESVAPYVQQLTRKYQGAALAERMQAAYLETREALIEEALLKAETKARGLSLPEKVVDEEVERLIRDRFKNDRALLTRALAARRMTLEEWKQEVTDQITVRVFYNQEVTRRANVPQQAVRDEYEKSKKERYFIPFRIKYRFILINKGRSAEELTARRTLAEATLSRLRAGESFDAVGKEVSEGDLAVSPWRSPDDVRAELRPALRTTAAGGFSELIETPGEFYIVRVEERREEGYVPFEEVQREIETQLLEVERDRLHRSLIDSLMTKHFVERY